ncbi:MAG: hypothetical protein IPO27_08110 [Bacteroidetes bacterium]|nr:hypothetical protein [Bacteroidota bacterium]
MWFVKTIFCCLLFASYSNNKTQIPNTTFQNNSIAATPSKVVAAIPFLGNTLWLAPPLKQPLPNGLFVTTQNFNTNNGLALSSINCSYCDKQGNVWFGTDGGGVSRYDGKSFTNFTTSNGLANNAVVKITEDTKGAIWFLTNGGGICSYNGISFTIYSEPWQGVIKDDLKTIYCDQQGTIWLGTKAV